MIKLDKSGKEMKEAIIQYLEEIGEYNPTEEVILIDSTCLCYEQYLKFMAMADKYSGLETDKDATAFFKFQALSSKNYTNFVVNIKALGISAIQRKKLNLEPEEEPQPDNIFDKIARSA